MSSAHTLSSRTLLALSLLGLSLAGCENASAAPPEEARSTAPQRTPAVASPRPSAAANSYLMPAATLWAAIGDLHGDLSQTRKALRLVGAIDERDRWVGGTLVVVQTGDVIDRGDEDREVIDLLERLAKQAKEAGGKLVLLTGNHELMNVSQDFRYVTRGSVPAFDVFGGRAEAFRPGGTYAQILSSHPIVVQLGDTVFVHGGVLTQHVRYGLDRINDDARSFMRGGKRELSAVLASESSPLWTRVYSGQPEPDCKELEETLRLLSATRMVVGHTPQNGINSACDERVWRIDVGMSQHYGGPVQVLKMQDGKLSVLRGGN